MAELINAGEKLNGQFIKLAARVESVIDNTTSVSEVLTLIEAQKVLVETMHLKVSGGHAEG